MTEADKNNASTQVQAASKSKGAASRARSVAFCGLSIAFIAVCAWVSIPLGPVPFTLQTFALVFTVSVLAPRESLSAIAIYLLMGAIGLPVFSAMRGGIGVIMGPSGGFLWGYFVAAVFAILARATVMRIAAPAKAAGAKGGRAAEPSLAADIVAGGVYALVSYVCGCAWYMALAQVDLVAALMTSVVPFVLVDALKVAAAIIAARTVRRAIR